MKPAFCERIRILGIPVDCLRREDVADAAEFCLTTPGFHQIVLLDTWTLLSATRRPWLKKCLEEATFVLPTGRMILAAARFLRRTTPPWQFMPFQFVIRFMGALEQKNKSIFLIGGNKRTIQVSEFNLKTSFPSLRMVGRYQGYFSRPMEKNIITAIKKATPSLLLTGVGLRGSNRWVYRVGKQLQGGIGLWCSDCFDIFAGNKRRPSYRSFSNGSYMVLQLIRHPWRILRFFVYAGAAVSLVFERLVSSGRKKKAV